MDFNWGIENSLLISAGAEIILQIDIIQAYLIFLRYSFSTYRRGEAFIAGAGWLNDGLPSGWWAL